MIISFDIFRRGQSIFIGEGEEWMEVVSVEVLRGEGDLELGGLIAKGSCKNGDGEDEVGRGEDI